MRGEHPEFEGATAVYAGVLGPGECYAEAARSPRASILTLLGFSIPEEINDLAGDLTYAEVSEERLDLFDRDVLVWEIGDLAEARAAIDGSAVYPRLAAPREGRDVFVQDALLAGAMALISVLSLPIVLDRLVPKLAAAVDGDPTTEVPQ